MTRGSRLVLFFFFLCLSLGIPGCMAGEGTDLDENGNPISSDGAPGDGSSPQATLAWLQANVFTAICGQCHQGASAPLGVVLSPDAYQALVREARVSQEIPSMYLVEPGDPESSYLVWKIEGRPGIVGEQMPLGQSRLPQETIEAIKTWIADGAPEE